MCTFPLLLLAGGKLSIMISLQSDGVFTWTMQRPQYNAQPKGVYNNSKPCLVPMILDKWLYVTTQGLHHPVFTNTMFSNTYLRRNNKCAQAFTSDFGWVCLPHKDQRQSTQSPIPGVPMWGLPTISCDGWLKGTDLGQVLSEACRWPLAAEADRALLSLAECSWKRDKGTKERIGT